MQSARTEIMSKPPQTSNSQVAPPSPAASAASSRQRAPDGRPGNVTHNSETSEDVKLDVRSSNCNESLSSSDSGPNHAYSEPVQLRGDPAARRFSIGSAARSLGLSIDSNRLGRTSTGHSVREIYGDMTEDQIMLQRTQSKKTVMQTLSEKLDGPEVYDDVPDIPLPVKDYGAGFHDIDPELITWEGDDDPEYPRNWNKYRKILQIAIVSFYTLVTPFSSTISSPATPYIAAEFGITNNVVKSLTVSVMVLAFAIGPLIIAPISESDKIGRKHVLNASIWILFAFNLGCSFCKTTTQLCVLRFLGGLGGCAALNVGAGTIADLYDDKDRNVVLAIYSVCPSIGPVIAPVVSGFIVKYCKWNWVFWVASIFNGVVALIGTFLFEETYSPKLLHDKATSLRKSTGNEHLHTIFELTTQTPMQVARTTALRPLKLLTTHPMVFGLGSYMAFTYGFMYLMLVTFPEVFQGSYNFTVEIAGLLFIPMGIGYILGIIVWTYLVGRIYDVLTIRNNGVPKPEYRLPCLVASGVGIPIGLIWYGWSVEKKLHWIMPSIGTFLFAFSFVAVFQTIQNYLIDMNPRFAASSIAAGAVFRSFFGFGFPLFGHQMYDKLGYGWGNTMCAFIALALGIPFPVFCFKYGERLRLWANKRLEVDQLKNDTEMIHQKLDEIEEEEREELEIQREKSRRSV